jgi:RNA polymerase sigma factor (sigma-70 family)
LESQEIPLVASSIYNKRTDPELVALCLNGDALAWEALIMRYRRFIYSIPVRFGFRSADSADVFQTVCLKLIEHLHEVKDESKLSAWLATVTTRQCLSAMAARHREAATADEEFDDPPDPAKNLEEIRILTEQQQAIRDCVEDLPPRCRSLLQMLYLDPRSLTYQEISHAIGMPVASMGPNRARCLEKLKKILHHRGIK